MNTFEILFTVRLATHN